MIILIIIIIIIITILLGTVLGTVPRLDSLLWWVWMGQRAVQSLGR